MPALVARGFLSAAAEIEPGLQKSQYILIGDSKWRSEPPHFPHCFLTRKDPQAPAAVTTFADDHQ
jgi:hypothetical protein